MSLDESVLQFAWWNLQNFAHYDPNRAAEPRWPLEEAEYAEKCRVVDGAIQKLVAMHPFDIFGVCEITPRAAEDLQARLFPDFNLIFPDPAPGATFQTAVFYRRNAGFKDRLPLHAHDVPRTTRGMAIVDHYRRDHAIRFIFCHWTSFGDQSRIYRERLAETVSSHIYKFLTSARRVRYQPHVVVVGDLNVEPFGDLFEGRLGASRDRARSGSALHPADHDTQRVKLYNTAWRHLGERRAHDEPGDHAHFAGTYYNSSSNTWHTYDQVLVSGSLVGKLPPYLEERSFGIVPVDGCLNAKGIPEPFRWRNGRASGLSDHLPLAGRIQLPSRK